MKSEGVSTEYRVVRKVSVTGEERLAIFACLLDEEEKLVKLLPNPIFPAAESVQKLEAEIGTMLGALRSPVIEWPEDEEQLGGDLAAKLNEEDARREYEATREQGGREVARHFYELVCDGIDGLGKETARENRCFNLDYAVCPAGGAGVEYCTARRDGETPCTTFSDKQKEEIKEEDRKARIAAYFQSFKKAPEAGKKPEEIIHPSFPPPKIMDGIWADREREYAEGRCFNLSFAKCKDANVTECLARLEGRACPTFSDEEIEEMKQAEVEKEGTWKGLAHASQTGEPKEEPGKTPESQMPTKKEVEEIREIVRRLKIARVRREWEEQVERGLKWALC